MPPAGAQKAKWRRLCSRLIDGREVWVDCQVMLGQKDGTGGVKIFYLYPGYRTVHKMSGL